ncbi:MAG: type IV pili methyl-accepting chemotaxis transducer N-terminal domain-containing protein [Burkholderiales bacterium]|nr:type IV pili methyl-accepting chemotaxis transducer N-terminal domain-containing protein [Burkholderiales bacterium]
MLQLEAAPGSRSAITTFKPAVKQPKLSGEIFATLINLAGRRRFTSQRLVLHAVLASLGHEGALQIAKDALKLFHEAHLALVQGNGDLPGVFCESLRAAYFEPAQGDKRIRDFISLAKRTLEAIDAEMRQAPALLEELVSMATPLLNTVNQLTSIYEQESKRHSLMLKKQRVNMMTDIERIARQARMVSFNAQIVAARAGLAGREFSVVAGELSNITGELDELVQAALEGDRE